MTPLATELSKPEYAGLNAAQCLSKLLASTAEVRDDQLYTWAGVALIVGPQNAEALRLALESNGMGWAVHQLGGSGLQLSNDLVQQALLGFAQAGVDGCAELAAKGIHLVAPWQQIGLAQEPTLAEVEAALSSVNVEPDVWSHEVLLSVNRQADGTMQVFARVTPIGLTDGQVIQRGEAQVHVNGDLITAVTPIVEGLINA